MAKPGSTKWLSQRQERKVARVYGGQASPSSGAAISDQGDVRVRSGGPDGRGELFECKHAGTFDKPAKSISLKLADLEKIADEAWSEGRQPVMVLSMYAPDSVLADADGEVNVTVRLTMDDWRGRTGSFQGF